MKLNIQYFGGRGAISGIPKNKRKAIKSYKEKIKEHEEKIKRAKNGEIGYNINTIHHWEAEIKVFQGSIDKIIRRYKK